MINQSISTMMLSCDIITKIRNIYKMLGGDR